MERFDYHREASAKCLFSRVFCSLHLQFVYMLPTTNQSQQVLSPRPVFLSLTLHPSDLKPALAPHSESCRVWFIKTAVTDSSVDSDLSSGVSTFFHNPHLLLCAAVSVACRWQETMKPYYWRESRALYLYYWGYSYWKHVCLICVPVQVKCEVMSWWFVCLWIKTSEHNGCSSTVCFLSRYVYRYLYHLTLIF